jgi:hypothetical protein
MTVPTPPFQPARLRSSWRAVLAVTVAATGPLALHPTPASAVPPGGAKSRSNGASVTIDRATVKAGSRIWVTGKNWKSKGSRTERGAKVTVKLDDATILAVFSIKGKRFAGWVPVPKQVKAGSHWLRFLAAEPATSIKSRSFKVSK